MNIDEITPKTKVIISVTNGSDMQARFMSKVMRNNSDSLLVIPFRHKGKRVEFSGKQVSIVMEVRDTEGVLWTFKGCHIIVTKKDGLIFHKIVPSMKNGIENKRGGRRFYVWEPMVADVEGVSKQMNCRLRDIGINGFSFALDAKKSPDIKDGTKVVCFIKDNDGIEIQTEAMTIRHELLDRHMVFGCKVDEPSPGYLRYVKYVEKKNTIVDVDF